jgi:S1-C subfamily serine protease
VIGVVAGTAIALGVAAVWYLQPKPTEARASSRPAEPTVPAREALLPPEPPRHDPIDAASSATADSLNEPKLLSVEQIVTRSLPAVVTVETADGVGSGFFVAPGTVVTNSHVVNGSALVTLRRPGGYMRAARVENNSPAIDLAILKLDIADVDQPVLPIGAPSDVQVGAEVVAIGSPLGLTSTARTVSAIRRSPMRPIRAKSSSWTSCCGRAPTSIPRTRPACRC